MADIVFYEFAALVLGTAIVALAGTALRQPVIVSFIAVGIAFGAFLEPSAETARQIEFLAELGVTSLLFLVGLKLDWRLVQTLGPVALATGLGQVAFTAGIGFLIGLALGLDTVTSFYIAVALTFSSTIIVVKLLSDKRELDTLHGRIALGFLIVQDLVVVLAMVVLSTFGMGEAGGDAVAGMLVVFGSLAGAAVALVLFVRYVADWLIGRFARVPELLVVFAIAWAAAAAAAGDAIGLGKEIGGLAAGVSLGSTPYREMVSARLSALRDFLLLFFFLTVGTMLDLSSVGQDVWRAITFSLFVLIGNPLIVVLIMAWMGYRARTGFLAGLTVAQISEFSLIFMAMGVQLGHVGEGAVGLVTLVGLVTIATSVYMILYSQPLYEAIHPLLRLLDFGGQREAAGQDESPEHVDVLLFGLGRFGSQLLVQLENAGMLVLAVDLDPRMVERWRRHGYRVRYGDVTEPEFWHELPLSGARWIVVAVPFHATVLTETDLKEGVLSLIRSHGFAGRVAVTARDRTQEESLLRSGATLVLLPFEDAAVAAVRQMVETDPEAVLPRHAEGPPEETR